MSLFEILTRFGLLRMAGFLLLGALFVTLHLIRLPLRAALWALTVAMQAVNYLVTGQLAAPDAVVTA